MLAHGNIRSDAEEQQRKETGEKGRTLFKPQWERNEDQQKMTRALEKVAQEVGAKSMHSGRYPRSSIGSYPDPPARPVAIAYVMQKVPYCFPIIGGRKIENMLANIEALDISLSHAQIEYLESIVPFDPGFPHTMIVRRFHTLFCGVRCSCPFLRVTEANTSWG